MVLGRMECTLPDPDITINIEENTTEPFKEAAQELLSWLANHDDADDILVGPHANREKKSRIMMS